MWPWVDDDWMARGMAQWINKSIMDGRRADSVFGLGLGNPFFNSPTPLHNFIGNSSWVDNGHGWEIAHGRVDMAMGGRLRPWMRPWAGEWMDGREWVK